MSVRPVSCTPRVSAVYGRTEPQYGPAHEQRARDLIEDLGLSNCDTDGDEAVMRD